MDPRAETRVGSDAADPFVGKTLSGYRIEAVIGRGGMGTVYRATQLSLGRPVALKVLPEDLARDPQFLERFRREADALSRLSHPNIVAVFDRGEAEGRPFLVMEYVEGASLREVVRKGPLPSAEALRIVSSVLAALEHAHAKGVVHRDVKPENVLLARGGVAKVADFGLSRLLGPEEVTRLTRTHLVLGTYEYMAPEQREHAREADARSDVYATGVILYEMLTGELPIGRFDLPSRRRPGECDRRVDELIEKSLEKDPAQRFQRAADMAAAVSAILESPRPRPDPHPAPEGGYRPARLESHVDNLATLDHVLGTLCYVVGLVGLFGLANRFLFGASFLLFFVAGWYFRENAENLRKFRPAARTGQAVIAILCAFTLFLLPFSIYSFWVLFGHRGRTYFEARGRGLDSVAAARYAYRVVEEPFGRPAPPPPSPAPSPLPPSPSQIPVQSVVTSEIARGRTRLSPFVIWGIAVLALTGIAGIAAVAGELSLNVYLLALPAALGGLLLTLGVLHALVSRRTKGVPAAFVTAVAFFLAAAVLLSELEPGMAGRLSPWLFRDSSVVTLGRMPKGEARDYEALHRDAASRAWLERTAAPLGSFPAGIRLSHRREGSYVRVDLVVPRAAFHGPAHLQRIAA
ncbi:MAG: protein kinase domain-containing protein, partial [Planctomycetota bacterium]